MILPPQHAGCGQARGTGMSLRRASIKDILPPGRFEYGALSWTDAAVSATRLPEA